MPMPELHTAPALSRLCGIFHVYKLTFFKLYFSVKQEWFIFKDSGYPPLPRSWKNTSITFFPEPLSSIWKSVLVDVIPGDLNLQHEALSGSVWVDNLISWDWGLGVSKLVFRQLPLHMWPHKNKDNEGITSWGWAVSISCQASCQLDDAVAAFYTSMLAFDYGSCKYYISRFFLILDPHISMASDPPPP